MVYSHHALSGKWIENKPGAKMGSTSRTAEYWSKNVVARTQIDRGMYWLENDEVQGYMNRCASGDAQVDWIDHTLHTHFSGKLPVGHMLSLGCGEGRLERVLAKRNFFENCDAYDIAPDSVDLAKRCAAEEGIANMRYTATDINAIRLPESTYDALWIEAALHHFEALEHVCEQMCRTLKPDGLLVLNEYIGATRFQFPERQKEVINACLALIPQHYRVASQQYLAEEESRSITTQGTGWFIRRLVDKLRDGSLIETLQRKTRLRKARSQGTVYQTTVAFPTTRDLIAADPSEAVRSADIMPVLEKYFRVVEFKPLGGTILQFLLGGICANFNDSDPASLKVLHALFAIEEALIACSDIPTDFAYIVASPRK